MNAKRTRILVVDDELDICEMVGAALESRGYDVVYAMDGKHAVERAIAERPDCIILDILIPIRNGFEVCRILRKDVRTQRIPILILTAKTSDRDRAAALAAGADIFLTKPITMEDLVAVIHRCFNHPKNAG